MSHQQMTEHIVSDELPGPAGPYSHVVSAGDLVWTAGFGPHDPTTMSIPDGIEAQTEATIDNLERALATVGLTLADVVKTTVHLQEPYKHRAQFNKVYGRRFPAPHPVRTTVGSQLLNILVEIEAVAARPR